MTYNTTVFTGDPTIVNVIQGVNTLTDGWYGLLLFIFIYLIVFVIMGRTAKLQEKLLVSGMLCSIFGLFLLILNFITFTPYISAVSLTVLSLVYAMWD